MSHWSSEYVLTKSAKVIGAFCCAGRGLSTKTRDKRNIPKQCVWLMAISILISSAHVIADSTLHFNIPRQNADEALLQFGTQADISVVYDHNLIKDLRTNQLHGEFTLEQGIRILLKDSGLKAEFKSSSHLVVTRNYWGIDQMNSKKNLLAATVAFFMGASSAQSVVAQDNNEQREAGWGLEEIIVTANKREQSLQDTAMAISALGADTIEKRGLVGMDDYLRTLPGVNMQDRGAGQNSVVIRSISVDPQVEEANVGVYFGETSIAGLGGSGTNGQGGNPDVKLVDIERIEVLRGPQGTLYGSGSMGGTVRVIPMSPNLTEVEGKLATRYSQTGDRGGDNTMVQAVLNVPLIEDKLAVRGVVYQFDNSGYTDNVAATQTPAGTITEAVAESGVARDHSEAGSDEYTGYRLSALWQPTDNLDITLSYLQQDIDQDGQPEVDLSLGNYQQVRLGVGVDGADRESLTSDIDVTNLVINYDLGWAQLTSSSSWLDYQSTNHSDMSRITGGFGFFTSLPGAGPFFNYGVKNVDKFSQEIRLASQLDGQIQFVAGVYYEDQETDRVQTWLWSGDSLLNPDPGQNLFNVPGVDALEQQALFGELSYELTDNFTATLGARYFDYDRESADGFTFNTNTVLLDTPVTVAETGTNYKLNLSYQLSDDTLVYGQWSEGFRLGRGLINPTPDALCDDDGNGLIDELGIPRPTQLDSDTSESFELGVKASFADQRITLNAAVYRINWQDIPLSIQASSACFVSLNAGEAVSEGVEVEMQTALTDKFRLDLSASYGEATLDKTNSLGNRGDDLPGSADFNMSIGLEYGFILAQNESFARIDYSYQSEYYSNMQGTGQAAGGFGQLNLKAGMVINQFDVDIFVNNLTNTDEFTWVESNLSGGGFSAYQLRPRTVGLNLGFRF